MIILIVMITFVMIILMMIRLNWIKFDGLICLASTGLLDYYSAGDESCGRLAQW